MSSPGTSTSPTRETARRGRGAGAAARDRVAQLVRLGCSLAALLLVLAALVVALELNQDNAAVRFVLAGAQVADLDVFTRRGGIKQFSGAGAATRSALVNYGVGAAFWLVVGHLADRVIRPRDR